MARELVPFFNAFNGALQTLKKRCSGEPTRLRLLVVNDNEVRKAARWFYFEAARFDRLKSQKRYLQGIPPWFIACQDEYNRSWAKEVYGAWRMENLSAQLDGLPVTDSFFDTPDSHLEGQVRVYEAFVPGFGLGAKAIESVMSNTYETYGLNDAANATDGNDLTCLLEGVEAWDFFHGEVRVDFAGIEERWRVLPRALVPPHLDQSGSKKLYAGVVHLLDDAVNAYLTGAQAASVITCRAIVEHLLKTVYVPHRIATASRPKLGTIIDWALQEPAYQWMRRLDLHGLKDFANSVVHEPTGVDWGPFAEAKVVKYLNAVRELIEGAPATS